SLWRISSAWALSFCPRVLRRCFLPLENVWVLGGEKKKHWFSHGYRSHLEGRGCWSGLKHRSILGIGFIFRIIVKGFWGFFACK
ncbi:hypothetical protein N334_12663, partial [Pelecanus crispus]